MSTLRNAVKRKTHKERAQPADRQRYGLLEKRKDYQQRARDYHRKEKALQDLRRKADDRNADEFYFAMEHRRTKAGVDIGRTEANQHGPVELKMMKGHDVRHVQQKLQTTRRRTERLRASLHFLGTALPSSHVVYVDDQRAVGRLTSAQHFNTPAELVDRCHNRPTVEQLSTRSPSASEPAERVAARAKRRQAAAYRMLSADTQRTTQLRQLSDRLELQKLMMGKGRKRRVSEGVVKWKKERKR